MKSKLKTDVERLPALAYHRLEWSGDVVRKFHGKRKTFALHADFVFLEKVYAWLFVPLTLWPIDLEGLVREVMSVMEAGKRLSEEMRLLIKLLPRLPTEKTQTAVMEHEHSVHHGNYESLIRAQHKFDSMEAQLGRDPLFQAYWETIKARFDTAKFQDRKQIIRRRMVAERSMRGDMAFRWKTKAERFQAVFDVFCQRWNLYGMWGDKPLLLKLTANLTPFGTMIFIPAYWSFDPKRDLDWHAITTLHKARGVPKQGPKLTPNQLAQQHEAKRAVQLSAQAVAMGLKGDARSSWVIKQLGWDSRTDDRKLRRLLRFEIKLRGNHS